MKYILLSLFITFFFSAVQAQVVHDVCAGDTLAFSVSVTIDDQVQWQQSIDGISFFDIPGAVQASHQVAGVSQTRYYRCRITGLNCNPWYSEVKQVNVNHPPVVSFAGLDSTYCISDGLATLMANLPGGTFSGPGVTGNTFNPNAAGAGVHTISYVVSYGPGCTATKTATTGVVLPPTTANAGPDITATSNTVTLAGNVPVNGAGQWSIASGTGGSFVASYDPTTNFTGNPNQVYSLVWTISNYPCPSSSDTMIVTMPTGPALPSIMCGSPAYTLYVHPTDNAGPTAWGCIGVISGATDDNNGAANTALIIQMCGQNTAAAICDNLVAFGFSDWYLPSNNELECLRANGAFIGGFVQGGYWSSTEGAGILSSNARMRTFPTGMSGVASKSSTHRIRCVRKD